MKRALVLLFLFLLFATWTIAGRVMAADSPASPAVAVWPESTSPKANSIFTATAGKDSYVDQANPSTNYGPDSELYISRSATTGDEEHALVYFDTSSLPANINVVTATLEVYSFINRQPTGPAALFARPEAVLSSWSENGVTWNNRPPSTYLNDPAVEYQQSWLTYDVTNIAQAWVDGTVQNQGIKLVPLPSQTGFAFFFDRNSGTTAPRLTISYEPAPPPCTAVTSVDVDGPTAGQTGSDYTFGATVGPVGVTEPFTYTWSVSGQPGSSDPAPTYNWATTGQKTVNLTVENCGGSISDTHTVTIEEPDPACQNPLTTLSLDGPTTGIVGHTYPFNAVAEPSDAGTPITFTWQAPGQSQEQESGDQNASDVAWSWSTTGQKKISLTAENCGATSTAHHLIDIISPLTLPDLSLGTPWYDAAQGTVGYILHNNGQSDAPAGHELGLYEMGTPLASTTITETIPGGGVRAGDFGSAWNSCTGDEKWLVLLADQAYDVEEGNELNNEYSALWPCDLQAPTIIAGPTLASASETTAQINWTTDEPTNGRLEYGLDGYTTTSVDDSGTSTGHSVTLTGLQPGTTYRMRAFANDNAGNEANSDWVYFETTPPGTDPPEISDVDVTAISGNPYEAYSIQVSVADATYVERVEFYLDDALIGTQYSAFENTFFQAFAPYALGYTRDAFYDPAGLPLEVIAYSTGGASSGRNRSHPFTDPGAPVHLTIWVPGDGRTILFDGATVPGGTTQLVQVWAAQYDWECTSNGYAHGNLPGLRCADANPRPASELRLYLNNSQTNAVQPSELAHSFTLDLSGYTAGVKELELRAYGEDGTYEKMEQDLVLEQGTPQLRMERTVGRQNNLFTVNLTIHNDGNGSAQIYKIEDLLQGFVAINRNTQPGLALKATGYYTVSSKFDNWINSDDPAVIIDLAGDGNDYLTIPPNDSFTIEYEAIPVIYRGPNSQDHYIGVDNHLNRSEVRYTYAGGQIVQIPFTAPGNGVNDPALGGNVSLDQAVVAAFASADYLLATSPYRLSIKTSNTDQIPDLLSDMARLARAADGVVAVTGIAPPAYIIDDLLEPGGYWYESLHPDFRQTRKGYVLFVGEDDVIPTQDGGWKVDYSDLRYASTGGAARPELVFGRIIGNDVGGLRQPIQAAVNFHEHGLYFDNSHALMWSGRGDGEGTFWDDVKAMDSRLNDTAQVTRFGGKNFASNTDLLPVLQQNSPGQDWIIYRGHGFRLGFGDSEDNAIYSWDVGTLDLSTRPVVMALACTTGNFAGGNDGIAEVFLKQGAAVFIGSVETSARSRNSDAARAFFNRWHSGRSVGDTLIDLMRDKWGSSTWWWSEKATWERWVYDYQLFGDPKYGRGLTPPNQTTTGAQVQTGNRVAQGDGFASTLEVTLPELEISTGADGWHYVSLPDGERMAKEGEYAVPVHIFTVHYPAGERVQDVTLDLRSGLEVTTGLNIPLTYFQLDEAGRPTPFLGGPPSGLNTHTAAWHPQQEQPFQWQIFENADGSSDLQLILYPFLYNPATTDGRFYRQWRFNVQTIQTDVSLERLETPLPATPGEMISLDLDLQNSGPAEDVVVSAAIHDLKGEPLAGLPLRTLHALQGDAGISLTWDTAGFAPGDYQVIVTLAGSNGRILDRRSEVVTLASSSPTIYLPVIQSP